MSASQISIVKRDGKQELFSIEKIKKPSKEILNAKQRRLRTQLERLSLQLEVMPQKKT